MGKISLFIFFSSFIISYNVSIAQNKPKYKSVEIVYKEWLLFNESPKVFNNGDSIPIANSINEFNDFSNQNKPAMYLGKYNAWVFGGPLGVAKNVCPVGYHVPTDHDISLIQQLTDTILGKKHSEKCDKTVPCDKLIELSQGIPNLIYSYPKKAKYYSELMLKLMVSSFYCQCQCQNCSSASKEYKKICEKCKGKGWTPCKKNITCPLCDGTSVYSYYDDPTILDYKSVLIKKGFPNSFYTVDSYSENPRYPFQLNDNATEPQLVCKAGKSVTEIRIEKIAIEKEQDIVTLTNIDKFLKENNLEQAVKKYNTLNFKNPELSKTIQAALDKKYGNEFQEISGEKANQLIKNYTYIFKNLTSGKHEINVDRNGKLFVVGQESIKVANIDKYRKDYYGGYLYGGFTVDQNARATVNVVNEVKPAKDAIVRYQVSRKGYYACRGIDYRGKIYKKTFWTMSRFHEDINTEYNNLVPKNTVWLVKAYNEKVIVEGITVSDLTKDVNEGSEKIIKRFPKKIMRIVSLFVIWPAAIFYSSIILLN
jgi:hypothetical protein